MPLRFCFLFDPATRRFRSLRTTLLLVFAPSLRLRFALASGFSFEKLRLADCLTRASTASNGSLSFFFLLTPLFARRLVVGVKPRLAFAIFTIAR